MRVVAFTFNLFSIRLFDSLESEALDSRLKYNTEPIISILSLPIGACFSISIFSFDGFSDSKVTYNFLKPEGSSTLPSVKGFSSTALSSSFLSNTNTVTSNP